MFDLKKIIRGLKNNKATGLDGITNENKFSGNYNLSSIENNNQQSSSNLDIIENYELSLFLENWLAGQMYCLPQILPMFLPNVNSYKRLVYNIK